MPCQVFRCPGLVSQTRETTPAATVLSQDDKVTCILPENWDLPLMVSVCPVFPPRLTESNSMVAWAYTFAQIHNVSHCWAYIELPDCCGKSLPPTCLCRDAFKRGIIMMPKVKQNARNQAVDPATAHAPPGEATVYSGWQ